MKASLPVYVIGDSHSCIYSGDESISAEFGIWPEPVPIELLDWARPRYMGAKLAYTTTVEGYAGVLSTIPVGSTLLFLSGEIDVYYHIYPQAMAQDRSFADVVQECVDRYLTAVRGVRELAYCVGVRELIPSEPREQAILHRQHRYQDHFPDAYRVLKENQLNILFNDYARKECARMEIPFVEVFDAFVAPDGMANLEYYIHDRHHLNAKAIPILKERMYKAFQLSNKEKENHDGPR